MERLDLNVLTATVNGTGRKASKAKAKAAPSPRTARKSARRLSGAQRAALVPAGIGVGLLGLSLTHCTESISLLTGSGYGLSALLALGIDAGMVAAEWSALHAEGRKSGRELSQWCGAYIVATVLLSILLNCYAFGLHAAEGMTWAAYALGVFVPSAVYTLFRVAGKLWLAK